MRNPNHLAELLIKTPSFRIDRALPYDLNPEGKFLTKNTPQGTSNGLEKNSAGRDPFDFRGHFWGSKERGVLQHMAAKYRGGRAAQCVVAAALVLAFAGRSSAETVIKRAAQGMEQ